MILSKYNLKIKYHYLDTTFTTGASSFVATMNAEASTLQKNYKNVRSWENDKIRRSLEND